MPKHQNLVLGKGSEARDHAGIVVDEPVAVQLFEIVAAVLDEIPDVGTARVARELHPVPGRERIDRLTD